MQRDWNLIRLLLLEIESGERPAGLDKYTENQAVYHSALLVESEMVHGVVNLDSSGTPVGTSINRLTWKGHDFLDETRNDTMWKLALSSVKKAAGSATAEILQGACRTLLTSAIEASIRAARQA